MKAREVCAQNASELGGMLIFSTEFLVLLERKPWRVFLSHSTRQTTERLGFGFVRRTAGRRPSARSGADFQRLIISQFQLNCYLSPTLSLMPKDVEPAIRPQAMADLIALQKAGQSRRSRTAPSTKPASADSTPEGAPIVRGIDLPRRGGPATAGPPCLRSRHKR